MAEFAGFTNNDAAPTDCCAVLLEIAEPDAVNIPISVASILGLVTQFVAISPRATVVKLAAVVQRLVSANSKDDDGNEFGLSEEERQRLLEEAEAEIENLKPTLRYIYVNGNKKQKKRYD